MPILKLSSSLAHMPPLPEEITFPLSSVSISPRTSMFSNVPELPESATSRTLLPSVTNARRRPLLRVLSLRYSSGRLRCMLSLAEPVISPVRVMNLTILSTSCLYIFIICLSGIKMRPIVNVNTYEIFLQPSALRKAAGDMQMQTLSIAFIL